MAPGGTGRSSGSTASVGSLALAMSTSARTPLSISWARRRLVTTSARARRAAATVAESWPVKKAASQAARSSHGRGSSMRAEVGPPMTRMARSAVASTALMPRVCGPGCTVARTVTPIASRRSALARPASSDPSAV